MFLSAEASVSFPLLLLLVIVLVPVVLIGIRSEGLSNMKYFTGSMHHIILVINKIGIG